MFEESGNIDDKWEMFKEKLREIEDRHIPSRSMKNTMKRKRAFPVDKETLDKIKFKTSMSRKAIKSKDPEDRKKYNRARNQVKKCCKRLRKKFENDIATKAKSNPKVIWKYIKSKSKTREGIGDLHRGNDKKLGKTDKDQEKADTLCDFFSSVFVKEPEGDIPGIEPRDTESPMGNNKHNPRRSRETATAATN